jgi:hypothetical protein
MTTPLPASPKRTRVRPRISKSSSDTASSPEPPKIPQPLYYTLLYEDKKYMCPEQNCLQRFQTRPSYRGHYALVHILGLS